MWHIKSSRYPPSATKSRLPSSYVIQNSSQAKKKNIAVYNEILDHSQCPQIAPGEQFCHRTKITCSSPPFIPPGSVSLSTFIMRCGGYQYGIGLLSISLIFPRSYFSKYSRFLSSGSLCRRSPRWVYNPLRINSSPAPETGSKRMPEVLISSSCPRLLT